MPLLLFLLPESEFCSLGVWLPTTVILTIYIIHFRSEHHSEWKKKMFRRKHGPDFNSNDAEQREAKVSLKFDISS